MEKETEYLTIKDVVQLLRCSRTTIYSHLQSGRLRHFHIGKLVRIRRDDLIRFVEGFGPKRHRK